jgi:hypothetical protein
MFKVLWLFEAVSLTARKELHNRYKLIYNYLVKDLLESEKDIPK